MTVTCDFCEKNKGEVICIVNDRVHDVAICDECVLLCVEVIVSHVSEKPKLAPPWHVMAAAFLDKPDEPD